MTIRHERLNCFTCQARTKSEWCALTDTELELLNKVKTARAYVPGEVVYSQGDEGRGVYCVESGLIGHRRYDAEGNSVLIRLCGPGETTGYRALLSGSEHLLTAEILMPARICFIERGLVHRLLTENPALGLRFLNRAVSDLTTTEDRFFHGITQPAKVRAIHMLLVLYRRFGERNQQGDHVLDLPLSRQDLAALIGITPESMSRMIKKLEQEKIARFHGRRVHLPDLDKLFHEIELQH